MEIHDVPLPEPVLPDAQDEEQLFVDADGVWEEPAPQPLLEAAQRSAMENPAIEYDAPKSVTQPSVTPPDNPSQRAPAVERQAERKERQPQIARGQREQPYRIDATWTVPQFDEDDDEWPGYDQADIGATVSEITPPVIGGWTMEEMQKRIEELTEQVKELEQKQRDEAGLE